MYAEKPVDLEDVEDAKEIVKRFCTGKVGFIIIQGSVCQSMYLEVQLLQNQL